MKAYALLKVPCTRQREMVSKKREAQRVRVRRGWVERTRGGAYAHVRDAGDIPRLEWLVEGPRVIEGKLHSAKRW